MNVILSSDDNYARHLGVAIYSLLSNNTDVERIHIFVIDNQIENDSLQKLCDIVKPFANADIKFVPFAEYMSALHLNMVHPISLSSYARLFIAEMLPDNVDRVLYMDCDMCVMGSLSDLWNWDLKGNCLGAIQDTMPTKTKADVGLSAIQRYFNAGLLLIDLKKWRSMEVGKKCLVFIDSHNGLVKHHDQGVLNGVLKEHWERLPLRFNVMTIHYILSQTKILRFYKDESPYYDAEEVVEAIKSPIILHYTPSLTSRPWEKNCKHPLRVIYKEFLDQTPWKGYPLVSDNSPWYVRLINLRYRLLPIL